MNPGQKEALAVALLQTLEANSTRFGLAIEAIMIHARIRGFTPAMDEMRDCITYLEASSRHYIERVEKPLGRANPVWRITAEGVQYLDERDL